MITETYYDKDYLMHGICESCGEESDEIEDLYLCDALGDNQYLIIEDGKFKPMKYEKV